MRDRNALAFSPDGHSVVAARNTLKNESVFVLDVWAADTGEKTTSIPAQPNSIEHTGTIAELAFAPGGKLMASSSWDHSVRLWSFNTRQRVKTLHGNPSEIWTLAFAPGGAAVITGGKDGTVRRWPINPATQETFYEGNWMPLRFSSNGETLAAIDEGSKVVALNLQTGETETQLQLGKNALGGAFLPQALCFPPLWPKIGLNGKGPIALLIPKKPGCSKNGRKTVRRSRGKSPDWAVATARRRLRTGASTA